MQWMEAEEIINIDAKAYEIAVQMQSKYEEAIKNSTSPKAADKPTTPSTVTSGGEVAPVRKSSRTKSPPQSPPESETKKKSKKNK